jgi:class 3 adenylate cyclase/CHASE2 domain-containing sensor protein
MLNTLNRTGFILLLLLVPLLVFTRVTEPLDLRLLDAQFRFLRAKFPQPAAREVVVIGIDEETAKRFPEPLTLWHAHLGRLFSALAQAKPAVLGIDIILPDRSYDRVLPGSDKQLLKGLLEARFSFPIVLGETVDPAGRTRSLFAPFVKIAGASGYALFPVDPDGVVRRFDERLGDGGQSVPTLVGEMARKLGHTVEPGYINYHCGAPFGYLSLQQVLQWADAGDRESLVRAFGGKPVVLGTVFQYEDRQPAPAQLAAWDADAALVPGVLLHAQALRSLLNGGLVHTAPAIVVALVCAILAALWLVSVRALFAAPLFAVVALAVLAASTALLAKGWHVPAAAPILMAAIALGGRNGYDTLQKLLERRRLRASFGGYVSPPVMQEILAGRLQPELGGVNQFVCILFSDIRGYTTRSESMTPEQIIGFLNRYFERTVRLIHDHGGAVVCFMGDGIMAVFGAPQKLDDPCREAFEAAREMLKYVSQLNGEFRREGIAPLEIGIGLHAGEAVVGHVGSSQRHDYTAIGDVTNVASRLESLTKEAGYRVVVSRVVADALGPDAELTALGPMAIKGHTPVEVYGYDKT